MTKFNSATVQVALKIKLNLKHSFSFENQWSRPFFQQPVLMHFQDRYWLGEAKITQISQSIDGILIERINGVKAKASATHLK